MLRYWSREVGEGRRIPVRESSGAHSDTPGGWQRERGKQQIEGSLHWEEWKRGGGGGKKKGGERSTDVSGGFHQYLPRSLQTSAGSYTPRRKRMKELFIEPLAGGETKKKKENLTLERKADMK